MSNYSSYIQLLALQQSLPRCFGRLFLALGLLFCSGLLSAADAEYIDPSEVSIETERYRPEHTDFAHGRYTYSVQWQGIPVAEASVDVRNREAAQRDFYSVTAQAKTDGIVSVFYRMRHRSSSVFDAESLQPVHFLSEQKEKRREKTREVSFHPDGRIQFVSSKNGRRGSEREFKSSNLTLDPISAAFVARSLPIDLGTKASFDVFNGKHRYLITCEVQAREVIEVAGHKVEAFRVVPTVEKLTDSKDDKRLESATIWISADEARHVLKLESKVWVGSVTAELASFTPSVREPSQLARARFSAAKD